MHNMDSTFLILSILFKFYETVPHFIFNNNSYSMQFN